MTDWADRAKERSWGKTVLKTTRKNTRNISDPEVKQLWNRFEEEKNNMDTAPLYPRTLKDIKEEKLVDYWRRKIPEILVSPFNKNVWSLI